eukprot:SM000203S06142  [mRNA]  locus=s203:165401:167523:+ [translate_table: standard]
MAIVGPDAPPLAQLAAALNAQTAALKEAVLLRGAPPASAVWQLAALDASLCCLKQQYRDLQCQIRAEAQLIPQAQRLIEAASRQHARLEHIAANLPSRLPGGNTQRKTTRFQSLTQTRVALHHRHALKYADCCRIHLPLLGAGENDLEEGCHVAAVADSQAAQKGRKMANSLPRQYIGVDDLASVSSYMRGRLTIDKVNTALDELVTFAEATEALLGAPKRKLSKDALEKVVVLKEVAATEGVRGKGFLLESDLRGGLSLKLDNSGRAILTVSLGVQVVTLTPKQLNEFHVSSKLRAMSCQVLRHLGRITEVRIKSQRVILIQKL